MNPLSTYTYYARHRQHVGLLSGLSVVIAAGLFSLIALVWAVFVEQPRLSYMTLSQYSMVTPRRQARGPEPDVLSKLLANSDIDDVISAKVIPIQLPGLMPGDSFQFELLGLEENDLSRVLDRLKATLKEGQLPLPQSRGLALSEDVARMLDVTLGDDFEAISSEFYVHVDMPLESTTYSVVGILESEVELGVVSLEFLNGHPLYSQFPTRYLIAAREDREAAVDDFLRNEILSVRTSVRTLSLLNEQIINEALPGLLMLLPIVLIVAIAFSLVIVVINQIANSRRLPEFGILHATGHDKRWLVRRLTLETTTLAIVGWLVGIGLAWLLLSVLRATYFSPRGYDLEFVAWVPIAVTLPLPATIAAFTFISARRTLARLDPVAIVERGKLSLEGSGKQKQKRVKSSLKPLAPATFCSRHTRRAAWLIGSMSLMILAVAVFVFALVASAEAQEPLLGFLSRATMVRAPEAARSLDASLVVSMGNHPGIERVIRVAPRTHMLDVYVPPFNTSEASPLAVYAEDMEYLVELYGLELREGRLPHPGTNEMVIPEVLAKNRQLGVGSVIGKPDQPAYPGASALPKEFRITGVFAKPRTAQDGDGLGFISLEFLESSDLFPMPDVLPVIIVAMPGQKMIVDRWLEDEVAKSGASLMTYQREVARIQQKARQDMFSIAILEGIIALVAALGLAVLNHIYTSQRQPEFGVLHALGYGRRQLVGRVLGEAALTTGIAWLISAGICLIGMLGLRLALFAPRGLSFDLANVTPWLYTIPIPLLVLVVTALTAARNLSQLDAVAIVEQRIM